MLKKVITVDWSILMNDKTWIMAGKDDLNRPLLKTMRGLKKYAGKVGMTIAEASRKLGISSRQLGRYENTRANEYGSQQNPKLETLRKMVVLYQIPPERLLNVALVPSQKAPDEIFGFAEIDFEYEMCEHCGGIILNKPSKRETSAKDILKKKKKSMSAKDLLLKRKKRK